MFLLWFGGNREKAIQRDGSKCRKCGLTREEHYRLYKRDITVDHVDGNRSNNALSNLHTLCCICHGKKDIVRRRAFEEYSEESKAAVIGNLIFKSGYRGYCNKPRNVCRKGHEFTPETTYVKKDGRWVCKICRRKTFNAWRALHPKAPTPSTKKEATK